MPTPYVQNWNLNIEQQLSQSVALQVGYVGSKGTSLARLLDANQPDVNGDRVVFPQYGAVDEFATVSASTYNALQTTLRTKNWNGLSGFVGYTWSKSLDDASDAIDFNFSTVAFPQDSTNLKAEHGPSNFDTRHRFTTALTYQLPKLFRSSAFGGGLATQHHHHSAERAPGTDRQRQRHQRASERQLQHALQFPSTAQRRARTTIPSIPTGSRPRTSSAI